MKQREATRLLNRASGGEIAAAAELLPMVYAELRALAAHFFRDERDSHTLQPTALVHEAYVKLIDQSSIEWKSRNQFFLVAAKAMRNILVDYARSKRRLKRGGGSQPWQQVTMDVVEARMAFAHHKDSSFDLERLESALEQLAAFDERKARLVELRFFAGLSEQEAADVMGIARSTASEHWRMARAWLQRTMKDESA